MPPKYFIGIDISADDYSASCITNPDYQVFSTRKLLQNIDGYNEFNLLISKNNIKKNRVRYLY